MAERSVSASAASVLTLGKARTWQRLYGSPAGVSIAAPMTAKGDFRKSVEMFGTSA